MDTCKQFHSGGIQLYWWESMNIFNIKHKMVLRDCAAVVGIDPSVWLLCADEASDS